MIKATLLLGGCLAGSWSGWEGADRTDAEVWARSQLRIPRGEELPTEIMGLSVRLIIEGDR
jgi:hypothetical protein